MQKRTRSKPRAPSASTGEAIRLEGVRQNNLKGFDLDLPLGKLIVVTGLSGAGKSSLVFETLHAEGQRRYVETFSPYTRQFMEMLDRPRVDRIENIRPSIAIQQSNTVKTSRSTVGTMTELTDYAKVWFAARATLYDPATGEPVEDDNPQSIWRKALAAFRDATVLLTFPVRRPGKLGWTEILGPLGAQGYTRVILEREVRKLAEIDPATLADDAVLAVVQDRVRLTSAHRNRFLEAATTALHFGQGEVWLHAADGRRQAAYSEGLHTPGSDRRFAPATPALFSFNSPVGACPQCRGFGRVIEIDPRLVIPDERKSLKEGAIRAFQGSVYSESQRDLLRACKAHGIPVNVPWAELTAAQRAFVYDGEPDYGRPGKSWPRGWYGIRRFFAWLETNTYKMHVRVFLAKYRAYVTCPSCGGTRLQPDALNWKWQGRTLPALYQLPVTELLRLLETEEAASDHRTELALTAMRTRLRYLEAVGLGYLTLDRSSRTLSGGETERVNLTSCLGTALTDTLFVLDEPSIGLHARDIDRLIRILRRLVDQGNTVVVVEHDESVMRAADWIVEIGPEPGIRGGEVVYAGPPHGLTESTASLTGAYLSGRRTLEPPAVRRPVRLPGRNGRRKQPTGAWLHLDGIARHNLRGVDLALPLGRLVVLSGVSGSGKSTLLEDAVYRNLLAARGRAVESPAPITALRGADAVEEVVLVDQAPVSRTPRSNAVLFVDAWDPLRNLLATTPEARAAGLTASAFSFNAGQGRCEHCQGLGYERVEMQFMADLFVECPVCAGQRFKPEVLKIAYRDHSVADILQLEAARAVELFHDRVAIRQRLQALVDVGLGYLPLGQPLNTLSGGESQRLKLVKYLARFGEDTGQALLLLDEPTTGLHRDDVGRLLKVLQDLVAAGHSVVVIEHQLDVVAAADWVIELGPEAGDAGGRIIFAGTPEQLQAAETPTAPFLREHLEATNAPPTTPTVIDASFALRDDDPVALRAAEEVVAFNAAPRELRVRGAREHNLRDLSLAIPHREMTVVTGVSGSGKSTLAFDIIFAEGQRRFMESMSAWARQFVEQLPRPEIDSLTGIPPTVAIEQRVTQGTRKSTVATITEVAQYLRLLYARVGVPHSPVTGEPLVALAPGQLATRLRHALAEAARGGSRLLYLCAPRIRGRKGHHQPFADWARDAGFQHLRVDGEIVAIEAFRKLDRYREHDLEVVVATLTFDRDRTTPTVALHGEPEEGSRRGRGRKRVKASVAGALEAALAWGEGACFLARPGGGLLSWFSTQRTDPATGESFPALDPKHFSWNSARGWCPTCRGHGALYAWMQDDENYPAVAALDFHDGEICPDCAGARLHAVARAVRLPLAGGGTVSLPELLAQTPAALLETLREVKLDTRGQAVHRELYPEISERLQFMGEVGLEYLTLDRSTVTLSGGEAQRIRLAAQLGSNLSGVLYVLDEPSIGLHAADNRRLIRALRDLRAKGNTLLVVEHDDDTMRAAQQIIDLGPGAGRHGGQLLAQGDVKALRQHPESLTGQYLRRGMRHPVRGERRALPDQPPEGLKGAAPKDPAWLQLVEPALRNLKGGNLRLPKARLIVVCGLSGAGKSTLIRDVLQPAAGFAARQRERRLTGKAYAERHKLAAPPFRFLQGAHDYRAIIEVDQNPIGKTPRSTPATYIGAFDRIREYFASLPEARMRGLGPGAFSFNTKGGRCETCKGAGRVKLEMNFMPDTYVPCEACGGSRFGPELEDIRWHGKNIADVLAMTFEEAADFFHFHARLRETLALMVETGLGYLTLGQSSPTLSGGEAQRLKLVSELAKGLETWQERSRGTPPRNLYLLEEPTIGLHLHDCERLIQLLHRLVDQGHTVVVIEHHLDVIAEADWLVELGPEGGEAGGEILFQGPVRDLPQAPLSNTASFLTKKHLKG